MATPEDHGKNAAADASAKVKTEEHPTTFFDPADHSTTIPKDVLDALEDPDCGRLRKGVRFAGVVPGPSAAVGAAVGEAEVAGCGGTTDEVLGKPAAPVHDTSAGAASGAAAGADAGTTPGADPGAGQPAADQGKAAKPTVRAKSIGEQLHELKAKMSPKK